MKMEVFVLSYQADGQAGRIFKVVGAFASLEAAKKDGEAPAHPWMLL